MKDDEVAERGGEASSSKSWNAESREMASMPFGSDVEGAAGQKYGAEGANRAWERMDNVSDFIAARMVIKYSDQDLFASRKAINT